MAFSCDILAVIQEKHTEIFSLLTFSLQYALCALMSSQSGADARTRMQADVY